MCLSDSQEGVATNSGEEASEEEEEEEDKEETEVEGSAGSVPENSELVALRQQKRETGRVVCPREVSTCCVHTACMWSINCPSSWCSIACAEI